MPRIISFAYTTPAVLADGPLMKTCTRRTWVDSYARSAVKEVDKGVPFWIGYDKNPRIGGKPVVHVKPIDIEWQNTRDMPDEDYRAEGFEFFDEREVWLPGTRRDIIERLTGSLIGKGPALPTSMRELFDLWREQATDVWVVRFERVEVLHATES